MTVSETIAEIVKLMDRLPGIRVVGHKRARFQTHITVIASGAEAIDSIQFLACSANVATEGGMRTLPDAVLVLTLRAGYRLLDGLKHGYLQVFGIHVLWRLRRLELVSHSESDPILRGWNAAGTGLEPAEPQP